jgi:S-adenosyl-L-methionine hydrolase (adenosine-forming)
MNFITLISDWNSADYYIGAIKGRILGICSKAQIIDLNHQISSYNLNQTAFILKNSYRNFPNGSIHIIAVNSEASKDKPFVVVFYDGHYFIGADNGVFHLFMDGLPEKIIELSSQKAISSFPELEIFALAAANLANGIPMEKLGIVKEKLFRQLPMLPSIEDSVIIGKVIYIDSYQNIITNVNKETFEQVGKNRNFIIYVQSKGNKIFRINQTYNESPEGELLALFNSVGYLEIAIRKGKVAELFNLTTNSTVRIVFDEMVAGEKAIQQSLF